MFFVQLVHTLNYGDAISGEAILIHRLLSEGKLESSEKIESAIYSLHAHEKVKHLTNDFHALSAELERRFRDGERVALILHYSLGSPMNDLFGSAAVGANPNCIRLLIHHNLTPERWFKSYNTRVTEDLRRGREEFTQLAREADLLLADSAFNRDELVQLGRPDAQVLPLAFDNSRWTEPANPGIGTALRGHGGRNILAVGRLAPNKCVEDIIKAFYFYHHKIEPNSRLWIVGADIDTEIYGFELRRLAVELRLEDAVSFVGAVADSELRAFYEGSELFVMMSEHEGFCVPLVEAMSFGLPVVAFDAGAVGATLGNGGVLVGKKSPAELAELFNLVLTDEALRESLKNRGRERVREFSEEKFRQNLEQLLVQQLLNFKKPSNRVGAGPATTDWDSSSNATGRSRSSSN